MRHLWLWLCGYVQICLNGRQINRFLNLCSRNGVSLWKISYDTQRLVRAHVRLKDFYLLKTYLRKSKTHLRVLNKYGFPFWCHRHPRLKWMLCVIACLFVIGMYSYTYVWNIEIKGNSIVSTEEILQCLENENIIVGTKRKDINCSGIEYMLRQQYNQLGWVSVYMDHTKLCIEMKESIYEKFEEYPVDDGVRYDLVSNRDAIIYSIVTRRGSPVVEKNMPVKKGDVLVLGQCEIYDDIGEIKEIMYVCAQALVYGDVNYTYKWPMSEIEIAAWKIAEEYTNKSIAFLANLKMNQMIQKLEENGVIILDKNVMIDKEEKNIVFTGTIKTREQIGINIPVEEVREYEFE